MFHPREAVDRVSETKRKVGEKLNWINWLKNDSEYIGRKRFVSIRWN